MIESKTSIVIAQYNENISWIHNLDKNNIQNIYLYTKNSNNINPVNHKTIPIHRTYLPNVGRESHTYLYHIINHYTNLDDFIFFVQGSNETLSLDDINRINQWQKEIPEVTRTDNFSHVDSIGLNNQHKLSVWAGNMLQDSGLNFFEWYAKFIDNEPLVKPYRIYWQANFGIKKEKILMRPLEYYQTLYDQLLSYNPECGHFMERSWFYIFNLHHCSR